MARNRFKLNPSKTELVWLDIEHGFEKLLSETVNINSVVITPVKSAKSFGVTLDDELKLVKHVTIFLKKPAIV